MLAIVSLSMAKSYIFQIFFKAWFIIIIFGIGNALILLPALLYFVSPCISNHKDQKNSVEHNSKDDES